MHFETQSQLDFEIQSQLGFFRVFSDFLQVYIYNIRVIISGL